MSDLPFDDEANSFEALSALADGQATELEIAHACGVWRSQREVRERWHAYQLIGDVMRSDTLAQDASADQAFLEAFRARLAQEPVVLAPAAMAAASAAAMVASTEPAVANMSYPLHRRRWAGPVAVAAGFVMVLGAVITTLHPQEGSEGSASPMLAQASRDAVIPVGAQAWVGQEATLAPSLRSGLVADSSMTRHPVEPAQASFARGATETAAERAGKMLIIRDPQLDEFLAAHRELAATGSFVPPAGLVRSIAFEAPAGR
jgi:sigma-E factor negative regulatory protein RseA